MTVKCEVEILTPPACAPTPQPLRRCLFTWKVLRPCRAGSALTWTMPMEEASMVVVSGRWSRSSILTARTYEQAEPTMSQECGPPADLLVPQRHPVVLAWPCSGLALQPWFQNPIQAHPFSSSSISLLSSLCKSLAHSGYHPTSVLPLTSTAPEGGVYCLPLLLIRMCFQSMNLQCIFLFQAMNA